MIRKTYLPDGATLVAIRHIQSHSESFLISDRISHQLQGWRLAAAGYQAGGITTGCKPGCITSIVIDTSDQRSRPNRSHECTWPVRSGVGEPVFRPSSEKKKPAISPAGTYAPTGIRTPVLALRGPCPWPLDDGGQSGAILPRRLWPIRGPRLTPADRQSGILNQLCSFIASDRSPFSFSFPPAKALIAFSSPVMTLT